MDEVRKMYPPVVDAMLSGNDEEYIAEFFKFRWGIYCFERSG